MDRYRPFSSLRAPFSRAALGAHPISLDGKGFDPPILRHPRVSLSQGARPPSPECSTTWEVHVARKKTRRGKRYPAAEKNRILAAARKEGLTAAQVQKRFGVSPLTFYRWRGPVRGRRAGLLAGAGTADLRAQVQSRVRAILPGVIRQEVNEYLASILGRGPGRPRGSGRGPGRPRGSGRRPGRPRKAK